MRIEFPSRGFDDAVAAVCHASASEKEVRALNELLRSNAAARDEYILRLELHSRLASDPDLFASQESDRSPIAELIDAPHLIFPARTTQSWRPNARVAWVVAVAACLALVAVALWRPPIARNDQRQPTSKAVAMLNRTADAEWNQVSGIPRLNAPLEPGTLLLEAGLAQVVFYSGARMVVEGPAELELISENEVFCRKGKIILEVPSQARGFSITTPHMTTTDLGTSFGLNINEGQSVLHVFKGSVKVSSSIQPMERTLEEGEGTLMDANRSPVSLVANAPAFASLFDFQARSQADKARRYDQWRTVCKRFEADASLLLHFNFENIPTTDWQIPNLGNPRAGVSDATIVGCQWTEGRWRENGALEFQSVNDRVRLAVPGEFQSLTLSAWVCVKGLDRKINSLFMSDGFSPGTIHWLIRRDGVLGLTVIGVDPRDHQIVSSPPVVTLDTFGMWLHLAVVLDAGAQHVSHYFNGAPVSKTKLNISPPFRIGAAELGNWNAKGFPVNDPFMIRNFSGVVDEIFVFNRALGPEEIRRMYSQGKPQGDTLSPK